ncbi:MAG: phytanoyl-CoA dioxygenase family protein [Gemmatimonadetes bacterium]|nr:phytanoyl-CoA dioxygenase family protein [Gemmatimonadota bacterium]|tara:strand:+ start:14697 stop:15485 length:789 start_codon:yes stop_codon:yes gene_type:complete
MTEHLTPEQIASFEHDGYLIVPSAIDRDIIERLLEIAHSDPELEADSKYNQNYDDEGIDTRLVYRGGFSEDAYSAVGKSEWLVQPAANLWNDSVCHFYHLNTQKNPNTGGWQYHQDYGYHYREFLYPDFLSVMVALDPATKENGCLKVLKGSNHLGRLEHRQSGSQLIADEARVAFAVDAFEEVHCELAPGDALFFHGNILHASNANLSDTSRWAMIYAYVAAGNTCVLEEPPADLSDPIEPLSAGEVRHTVEAHAASMTAT